MSIEEKINHKPQQELCLHDVMNKHYANVMIDDLKRFVKNHIDELDSASHADIENLPFAVKHNRAAIIKALGNPNNLQKLYKNTPFDKEQLVQNTLQQAIADVQLQQQSFSR